MPATSQHRAVLAPEVVQQLKQLFGTARNVHERLGLHPLVDLAEVSRALSGYKIKAFSEVTILRRWAAWRALFLASPPSGVSDRVRSDWEAGDVYDPRAYDPALDRLVLPVGRFTFIPTNDS